MSEEILILEEDSQIEAVAEFIELRFLIAEEQFEEFAAEARCWGWRE